jgi:lipoyl(octanoyl) transferase
MRDLPAGASHPAYAERVVDFVVTGLSANSVPYLTALERQRAVHADVASGRAPDTVLLLEHPSVYTAGKRTEPNERPIDGTPVIDVDRGGKITWHGPGQLVGYPIVRLGEPVDVVAYVRRLEGMLIDVIAEFGVTGERVEGRSGVWLRGTDKIAAIGIRVADGVTMHGFALNCSNSFDAYRSIIACGIDDAGVTSISRESGRDVTPTDVIPLIEKHFPTHVGPSLARQEVVA